VGAPVGALPHLATKTRHDEQIVADGELVVTNGHGAVAFESADAALDRLPLLVSSPQKAGGRP
jgi:ABC-type Zn uptake system ZnuABC Zn-binding protein ZnuA